ncbi:MAG TPA: hypothetical protein VGK10_16180 [Prolixibacteraceae bacterium]|jgi:hypothetical protein
MDLQTRKLKAIKNLTGIEDEKVFSKIESILIEVQNQKKAQRTVKPLTQEQLIERANRSTSDYLSGKFKTQEQLEKESENW